MAGFSPSMANRVQVLLSDRILGSTITPDGGVWNYSSGLSQLFSPTMPYTVSLGVPLPFWSGAHRPAAFLNFAAMEGEDDADLEDSFA